MVAVLNFGSLSDQEPEDPVKFTFSSCAELYCSLEAFASCPCKMCQQRMCNIHTCYEAQSGSPCFSNSLTSTALQIFALLTSQTRCEKAGSTAATHQTHLTGPTQSGVLQYSKQTMPNSSCAIRPLSDGSLAAKLSQELHHTAPVKCNAPEHGCTCTRPQRHPACLSTMHYFLGLCDSSVYLSCLVAQLQRSIESSESHQSLG